MVKITVDNNFFNTELLTNPRPLGDFDNDRISFYPSFELIGEFLSMYGTQKGNERLRRYSEIFLQMNPKRIINSWRDLLLNQLGIQQSQLYVDERLEDSLRQILHKLAQSQSLNIEEEDSIVKIKERVNSGKKTMGIRYEEAKSLYKIQNNYRDFEDFYSRRGDVIQKAIIKKIFQDNQVPINDSSIIEIINALDTKPYLNLYSRIYSAFVFYHYITNQNNQKIDGNDFYDHLYLIYLVDVDYLITYERRLKTLAELVFPGEN